MRGASRIEITDDERCETMQGNRLNRRAFVKAGSVGVGLLPFATSPATGKKERIRIGQIGVGHAHASKLSVYRASDDYEVVGVVEPDDELRRRAKTQDVYRDLPFMTQEELLNTRGLQAVLVETKVRDSLAAAQACIESGFHVHLDKPAGESFPHYSRILESAKREGLLVQMGYMYRYNPAVVLLREFLNNGWLGEVFEVHTVMSKVVNDSNRRALAEYRGGLMFELGCHILDLVIGVMGEPTSVTSFNQNVGGRDDTLVDNMLAVLEYPKAIASVKSSALEVDGFARRHFVVCGTEGTFHIQPLDNPAARVALSSPRDNGPQSSHSQSSYKSGYQELQFPKFTRYVDDAIDMARIIRGEKDSDFSYEHDLVVQETLLRACELSLDTQIEQ